MYKILIVDDEPLVQVGIKSMCNWQELNAEVCGTANNGRLALDLIDKLRPDIVISDIKMPVMDGLELLKEADKIYGETRPEFIMLTSYEDFNFAREALKYKASDYLIKLELTPASLKSSVENAIEAVTKKSSNSSAGTRIKNDFNTYLDKFMICLLNNLFESEEQMQLQALDFDIDLKAEGYLCCYGSFNSNQSGNQTSVYTGSLLMLKELAERFCPCYSIALDVTHFALIFLLKDMDLLVRAQADIFDHLKKINTSLTNYYNVSIFCGLGSIVASTDTICESYQVSRLAYRQASAQTPIVSLADTETMPHQAFHFSLFRSDLIRAYEEYNSELLSRTVNNLCDILILHPHHFVQALDAASSILYLSISLIQNGGQVVSDIFSDSRDGYLSLYHQNTVEQIVDWLKSFADQLSAFFDLKKKDYKNHIVAEVKAYIDEHIQEKLSLNEVAARFSINPSYLSQLFGKHNDLGFVEYINQTKINAAKRMLMEEGSKIYEVADALGFASEFYFSKVFKKVEGISPTEYINSVHG